MYRQRCRALSLLLFFVGVSASFFSCKEVQERATDGASNKSGCITYKLQWHAPGSEVFLNSIFPSELVLYFDKPNLRMEMSSMGGIGKAVFLLNTLSGEGNVMVSIVGVRSRYHEVLVEKQQSFLFSGQHAIPMQEPSDTLFMGEKCLLTEAVLPANNQELYRIIYSPRFGWKEVNNFSPFEGIEGIVLSGRFYLGRITVEMEAKEIVPCQVDPKLFQVEAGYKEVSRSTMEQLLGFGF